MKRAIILVAAVTLGHTPAIAAQHDHVRVVGLQSTVRVQTPQVDRHTQERNRAQQARERTRGDYREEQSETISRTLKVSELDLSNLAGDIIITRGGNSVQLEVVKTARGRTAEDAREMLGLVSVDIAERGSRAQIRTVYPRHDDRTRRNINVSVEYRVTAPEQTRISANSLSGNIRVSDMKADIKAVTLSGNVVITNAARVLSARSTSGNVEIVNLQSEIGLEANSTSGTVIIRNSRAPRMSLNTISGNVVAEAVQAERFDAQSISGNVEFRSPLSTNGRYELGSHSGVIRVIPTGNTGFELDANSFSGNIRSEITLKEERQGGGPGSRGPGARMRSLRGVYGDGSAILDITTFSGSVIIGKK